MDNVNSFKGYGKVSEDEERAFRKKTRRRYAIICAAAVVLVVIVAGAVVGPRVAHDGGGSEDSAPTASMPSVASSIRAVCNVTLYPDACFSTLTSMESSIKWNPEELFRLSMRAAAAELGRISALPDRLAAGVKKETVRQALEDCNGLFDEAAEQVNMSASTMAPGAGEKRLSKSAVDDLRTWPSSAVTDQQSCLDGLQEVSSELFAEMQAAIKNSTELTSNCLAIGTRIIAILQKFDISIHRKLLTAGEFPEWLAGEDRRLLQQESPAPDAVVAKDGFRGGWQSRRRQYSTASTRTPAPGQAWVLE